ncbi:MAG: hypothetical protein ACRYGL_08385 [Janthinobacterium lividum]
MQSHQRARENAIPGSATLFALRAIGILFVARWLYSMSEVGFAAILNGIGSSPVAILHLLYMFLLIALPGARPGVAHPFQPLPRWLRQVLRVLSVLGGVFAVVSIVFYALHAGLEELMLAVRDSNGWLVVAPALYFLAAWLCRRRAVWRTRATAGRFAIGCFGVEIDPDTRNATVWDQNRKIGQYAASELGVRQERAAAATTRIDLIWSSLAAAGHNRQRVFRVRTLGNAARASALALETALRRV